MAIRRDFPRDTSWEANEKKKNIEKKERSIRSVDLAARSLGICKAATRYRVNPCPNRPFFSSVFPSFFLSLSNLRASLFRLTRCRCPDTNVRTLLTAIFARETATSTWSELNCGSRERTNGAGRRLLDYRLTSIARTAKNISFRFRVLAYHVSENLEPYSRQKERGGYIFYLPVYSLLPFCYYFN